jgi:hypothetical protein
MEYSHSITQPIQLVIISLQTNVFFGIKNLSYIDKWRNFNAIVCSTCHEIRTSICKEERIIEHMFGENWAVRDI